MLEIKNLAVNYGAIRAVKNVSLEVRDGEIVALIGANGAGKSTTLLAVSKILTPSGGHIFFRGEEITNTAYPANRVVGMGLIQVPEGRRIFSQCTVEENLDLGAFLRTDNEINQDREKIYQYFPILGQRREQNGGLLSGGEQQMLAIGRALMARPKLLVLDEPSLGLAPLIIDQIFKILKEINNTFKTPILLVEQNAFAALNLSHRAYLLETGEVVLSGESRGLLENPEVKRVYLGGM